MNFEIQTTSYFDAEAKRLAKRYRSFIDDLQDFRQSLLGNPYQGAELSPGIRKIRLTIDSKSRGKSGGARVITFTYNTQANLNPSSPPSPCCKCTKPFCSYLSVPEVIRLQMPGQHIPYRLINNLINWEVTGSWLGTGNTAQYPKEHLTS